MTEREYTEAAERYLDMVYCIALNWFRHPPDAEDAAQNVMLRLWRTETEFESGEHLRRWLVKVTVNECKRISMHPWRTRRASLEACPEPVFDEIRMRRTHRGRAIPAEPFIKRSPGKAFRRPRWKEQPE